MEVAPASPSEGKAPPPKPSSKYWQKPQIMRARVMHKRLYPKVHQFAYNVFYLSIPLSAITAAGCINHLKNRLLPISFRAQDHGNRNERDLRPWAEDLLQKNGLGDEITDINLICFPRLFGYVFNPVSFWVCRDESDEMRAVICEVNNTFGETHTYICIPEDGQAITTSTTLQAQKVFHVSPFFERSGHYTFRFGACDEGFSAQIDYYDEDGEKALITSVSGRFQALTPKSAWGAFFRHPLHSLKVISLIHWHGLRLFLKGIKYVPKPVQKTPNVSRTHEP